MHTNILSISDTAKVLVLIVSEYDVSSPLSLTSKVSVNKKNLEQTLDNSIREILDFLEYYGIH